jgi:hypothetical protein
MSDQEKIKNRLTSLRELTDVSLEVSETKGTIRIKHRLHYAADFDFSWIDNDHYVGYFVDAEDNKSQAVVSIWTPLEAIKFVALYVSLIELRAKREVR